MLKVCEPLALAHIMTVTWHYRWELGRENNVSPQLVEGDPLLLTMVSLDISFVSLSFSRAVNINISTFNWIYGKRKRKRWTIIYLPCRCAITRHHWLDHVSHATFITSRKRCKVHCYRIRHFRHVSSDLCSLGDGQRSITRNPCKDVRIFNIFLSTQCIACRQLQGRPFPCIYHVHELAGSIRALAWSKCVRSSKYAHIAGYAVHKYADRKLLFNVK